MKKSIPTLHITHIDKDNANNKIWNLRTVEESDESDDAWKEPCIGIWVYYFLFNKMDKKLTAKYLVKTLDKFKSRVTAYDNYAIIVNNRHYTVYDFL